MEPIKCSKTSVFYTQTPGKYPEDNLSLLLHGESLKSNVILLSQIRGLYSRNGFDSKQLFFEVHYSTCIFQVGICNIFVPIFCATVLLID